MHLHPPPRPRGAGWGAHYRPAPASVSIRPPIASGLNGKHAHGLLNPRPGALGATSPPPPASSPPTVLTTGFHPDELAAVNDCLADEGIPWRVVDVAETLGPAWSAATVDPASGATTPGDEGGGGASTPAPSASSSLGRVAYLLAPPAAIAGGGAAHYPAALTSALEGLDLWPAVMGGAVPAHAGMPLASALSAVRAAHARHHGLDLPLLTAADVGADVAAFPPGAAITCHALLDAASPPAWRDEEDTGEEEGEEDASAVVVVDGLLTPAEAADLLAAITEPGWDAALGRPPPRSSWERRTADRAGDTPTWGARPGLVERLLADTGSPPASPFAALQARLCALYAPDYTLAFSPGEECDAGLTPLVANAVCPGDPAAYHLDADPACLDPAGAWAALHGLHPNRAPGKPLLASAIVYLQAWDAAAHNGETLFLDEGSGLGLATTPRPGRVVLMEGDVPHRICPPSPGAPGPRYSLVLKLVLHPTTGSEAPLGPSTLLRPTWGPPLRIGTAGVRGPVPLV